MNFHYQITPLKKIILQHKIAVIINVYLLVIILLVAVIQMTMTVTTTTPEKIGTRIQRVVEDAQVGFLEGTMIVVRVTIAMTQEMLIVNPAQPVVMVHALLPIVMATTLTALQTEALTNVAKTLSVQADIHARAISV